MNDFQSLCRICLTRSFAMESLHDQIYSKYDNRKVKIVELLSRLLKVEVKSDENYPSKICAICLSLLNISYEFVGQYEASDKYIRKKLRADGEDNKCDDECLEKAVEEYEEVDENSEKENCVVDDCNKKENGVNIQNACGDHPSKDTVVEENKDAAAVELIVNNKKYGLHDLVIVEDDSEDKRHDRGHYRGFLKNLGTEVSAKYVSKKSYKFHLPLHENEITIYSKTKENDSYPEESVSEVPKIKLTTPANQPQDMQNDDESLLLYPCGICTKVFKTRSAQMEHIYQSHNTSEFPGRSFLYNNDEVIIKNPTADFITHMKSANTVPKTNCRPIKLTNKPANSSNQAQNSQNDEEEFLKELYPCDICKKVYETKKAKRTHMFEVHHKIPTDIVCKICGFVTNQRSRAYRHSLKHRGKSHKCDYCDRWFYTRSHLKTHMNTHTKENVFLCNVCGKTFLYSHALKYHLRLHTDEKDYLCRYCGKTFRMGSTFARHLRVHTGSKPYMCNYCDKSFASNTEMRCHVMRHTGHRPFRCRYCNKEFIKNHNLKLHLMKHEGPHECTLCSRSFIEMNYLKKHMTTAHKTVEEDEHVV